MFGYRGGGCCDRRDGSRLSRRALVRGAGALAGGLALSPVLPRWGGAVEASEVAAPAQQGSGVNVRWLGGGVVELATPDDQQIAYVDAWVWGNTGWDRFGVQKPPEYASAAGFADYVRGRNPEAVFVLLTHDHPDHMGDYFELLSALAGAGLNLKTVGQSDLMRSPTGLPPRFREAGFDPAQIVTNGGNGVNFGGRATHGSMQTWLVPAVHGNTLGFPAAGFILDIGGVRLYASGDTDLFGDMRLIGERYRPSVALLSAGDGAFTMDPRGAAMACQMVGVSQAIPIHYAHNGLVLGPQAGEDFRQALGELSPGTTAQVMTPNQSIMLNA